MSLVENLARRRHSPMELMSGISILAERGLPCEEIAKKTGLTAPYVRDIIHLLRHGEERLIAAVERGQMPITVAMDIVSAEGDNVQQALADAYERNELRGSKLQIARRIVQLRHRHGKSIGGSGNHSSPRKITSDSLVRAYKQETERQRALIAKSDLTERRLLFIVSALKELFNDENFVTLLRAEDLNTLPRQLADLVNDRNTVL